MSTRREWLYIAVGIVLAANAIIMELRVRHLRVEKQWALTGWTACSEAKK